MFCGVNPKAINPKAIDPTAVNLDKAIYDAGILRHEIIKPGKIAHGRVLTREGGVSTIMVEFRIVKPRGHFDPRLFRWDDDLIGIICIGQPREVIGSLNRIS